MTPLFVNQSCYYIEPRCTPGQSFKTRLKRVINAQSALDKKMHLPHQFIVIVLLLVTSSRCQWQLQKQLVQITERLSQKFVKEIASFAATFISQELSSSHPSLTEYRTVSAQSQIASQTYKIDLKGKERDKNQLKCQVTVFNHVNHTHRMSKFSCNLHYPWAESVAGQKPLLVPPLLNLDMSKERKSNTGVKFNIVGGYSDIQVYDETVIKMATIAGKELLKTRDKGELKTVTVVSAGILKLPLTFKYKMIVEIESSLEELLVCQVIVDDHYIHLRDNMGLETTTNSQTVSQSSCRPQKTSPILQGYLIINLKEETIEEIAANVAVTLSQTLNSSEPLTVVSASRHTVTGSYYNLELKLRDRDNHDDSVQCRVIVLDQSRAKTREKSVIFCSCCDGHSTIPLEVKI